MAEYCEAVALSTSGKTEEAVRTLTKGLGNREREFDCLYLRGLLLSNMGKGSAGIADLLRCCKLAPTNGVCRFQLGKLYFEEEEYESAKDAFEEAAKLGYKGEVELWIRKCKAELQTPEAPQTINVNESSVNGASLKGKVEEASNSKPNANTTSVHANGVSYPTSSANGTVVPKYRMQWFQTESHMEINVFRKGIPPECVAVDIVKDSVGLKIQLPDEEESFDFETVLYGEVDVDSSSYKVLPSKVEVRLKKVKALKWPTLEKSDLPHVPASGNYSEPMPSRPTYPTSNIKSAKDWDSVDKFCAEELDKEKPEGEAALQEMFQKIFQQGDEDSRRAMQKSFLESNGTVLSTNWEEVGKGPVRCTPPEGIEVKKFGY
eukprot:jgi/Botrbrau1/4451/Bobra.0348s0037.1